MDSLNYGTVFEIARGTTILSTLADFKMTNGATPYYAGVTLDASGNLFGTTGQGGAQGKGTIWEIAAGTTTLTTIASFTGTGMTGDTNAERPQAGVTFDDSGNLFGTTYYGGSANKGTVWELPRGTSTIITVASFIGSNGNGPASGVTLDSKENLFGTTYIGGTANLGTVWEIASGSNTITVLASFTGPNGANPFGGVTLNSKGNLFGTTYFGGSSASLAVGTIWEIADGTTALTTVASFTGTGATGDMNAAHPQGGLIFDGDGNLFGTTYSGGSANKGTVWEIATGTTSLTTVASFIGIYSGGDTDGANPYGGVAIDSNGNLFGTTTNGGYNNKGVIYEISGVATPLGGGSTGSPTSHTQILWNNTNGSASLWTVNADFSFTSTLYGPFSGWSAVACADAPDGATWLLWANTSGVASLWRVVAGGYTHAEYGPYTGYGVASLSVGSDGNPHLLWDKTDGTALLWNVNPANGSFTYTSYGPFNGWTANAVASGATVTDLLWTNVNGTADGYRIAANGSLTQHPFGPYANYAATSLSVGPDDGAHLLWDKTDGTGLLWNADFTSGGFTYTPYGPFSGYAAKAVATGPDNVTHILWDATNGTASLWSVTGSGYTYHTFGPFSGWTAVALSAGR